MYYRQWHSKGSQHLVVGELRHLWYHHSTPINKHDRLQEILYLFKSVSGKGMPIASLLVTAPTMCPVVYLGWTLNFVWLNHLASENGSYVVISDRFTGYTLFNIVKVKMCTCFCEYPLILYIEYLLDSLKTFTFNTDNDQFVWKY